MREILVFVMGKVEYVICPLFLVPSFLPFVFPSSRLHTRPMVFLLLLKSSMGNGGGECGPYRDPGYAREQHGRSEATRNGPET